MPDVLVNGIFSKQVFYSTFNGRKNDGAELRKREFVSPNGKRLIIQGGVRERIVGKCHSVGLAIYWSIGWSSVFWF